MRVLRESLPLPTKLMRIEATTPSRRPGTYWFIWDGRSSWVATNTSEVEAKFKDFIRDAEKRTIERGVTVFEEEA